jgi:hypothetical protein
MPPPVAVLLGYGGWIRQPVRTGIGETKSESGQPR